MPNDGIRSTRSPVIARDFIVGLEHPVAGRVRSLGFPPHPRAGAITCRLALSTLG